MPETKSWSQMTKEEQEQLLTENFGWVKPKPISLDEKIQITLEKCAECRTCISKLNEILSHNHTSDRWKREHRSDQE